MAVADHRLSPQKKDHFIELGKKVGADTLHEVLSAMTPQIKLSQMVKPTNGANADAPAVWERLSQVPSDKLLKLRQESPDEYRRLYRAEYGMDCEMDDK